jgi:hypothetical protein
LNCSKEITVNNAEGKGDKVYCTKCFQELGLHRPTLNPVKHEDAPKEAETPKEAAPEATA